MYAIGVLQYLTVTKITEQEPIDTLKNAPFGALIPQRFQPSQKGFLAIRSFINANLVGLNFHFIVACELQ